MNPTEFKEIRKERNQTQREIAETLSLHIRTVQKYEGGELEIPEWVVKILTLEKLTRGDDGNKI